MHSTPDPKHNQFQANYPVNPYSVRAHVSYERDINLQLANQPGFISPAPNTDYSSMITVMYALILIININLITKTPLITLNAS